MVKPSSDLLTDIRLALTDLFAAIEGSRGGGLQDSAISSGNVAAALQRVSHLQAQLGEDAPGMLKHYLKQRSYEKALAFLETGKGEDEKPKSG